MAKSHSPLFRLDHRTQTLEAVQSLPVVSLGPVGTAINVIEQARNAVQCLPFFTGLNQYQASFQTTTSGTNIDHETVITIHLMQIGQQRFRRRQAKQGGQFDSRGRNG